MSTSQRIREIPYNYTSFTDREIVIRFLGEDMWDVLNKLRGERVTGRSARMLFEILGDMWVITRNPFIQDDLLENRRRRQALIDALYHRLQQVKERAQDNEAALLLAQHTHKAIKLFENWFESQRYIREGITQGLKKITRKDNIDFSGLARVSHVTDASDWRVEFPLAVISPDTEAEVIAIVAACIKLKLNIIPRGGGTGYTGGAVPLTSNAVVINTEKLESLGRIEHRYCEGVDNKVPVVHVEAGTVTRRVSDLAQQAGLVFAVDPTSQDASTIGGNISMNAGGKKAVTWGTTLDNLLSWKMVTPQAEWLKVTRINHNLGKIHDQQMVTFRLDKYSANENEHLGTETLEIPGHVFRHRGLGKDVTNKTLYGLPGIQKEGCDGLITSAEFILHRMPEHIRTVCLEFFDPDLSLAVPAIVESKDYIESQAGITLAGMEHLDERYVKAVRYSTKAPRADLPKMVLLIDIAGDDENAVASTASEIVRMANTRHAEGFVAISEEARERFWKDRTRTAAIAAHTNAFKINEDVVIPLENLACYSDHIERINIELSIKNKLRIANDILAFLQEDLPAMRLEDEPSYSNEDNEILSAKITTAEAHLQQVREIWQTLLDNLDAQISTRTDILDFFSIDAELHKETILHLLQRRILRVSYHTSIQKPLKEIFNGQNMEPVRTRIAEIHERIRNSRLFVATHMHAGDGNVHTNIPVNSNDYDMLHEADIVVNRIMKIARELDGVVSGEHGIGITKLQFLDESSINDFRDYKKRVDPEGHFNHGKLMAGADLQNAYTPSLRLLEQEALILEASDLGQLNLAVKDCLRCGKCKPVCNTHIPRANLLYSPRNKILATGLIIEAFLYEEQTRRGISIRHFDEMNDIADHCTVCHKCLSPCPVNIDFGDVSIQMRSILRHYGKKKTSLATKVSMSYLNATDPMTIKLMYNGILRLGYGMQSTMSRLMKRLLPVSLPKQPQSTGKRGSVTVQLMHLADKPLSAHVPKQTMRQLLSLEDRHTVPILRNPELDSDSLDSVFYFPGCGSERLFSEISMATLAMLYKAGAQTVLPPGYLCCGYPQTSNGDEVKGKKISTDNQVLFHRIANTLNYLDIKTVLVSCGTCMDQLMKYQFNQIFPGCELLDIHEYLLRRDLKLDSSNAENYLYHDPCHTPIKQYAPESVASQLLGSDVLLSDRCCGEAGTFALNRPDIATQVRYRKREELFDGIEISQQANNGNKPSKLLTSCPACQQGLSRYQDETGLETKYIVVELADKLLGKDWEKSFINNISQGGIERVLL